MNDVPEDKRFWVCDGSVIKNIDELINTLRSMNDDIFRYHVNENKNDFYNWIRDVIGDRFLANQIKEAKDRAETAEIVENLSKKKKCPYISHFLECMAGGEGNVNCLLTDYHKECEIKQKTDER